VPFFGLGKRDSKPVKRDPKEREKEAGAREYEARRLDRLAERADLQGDVEGAQAARAAAVEARRRPSKRAAT
jgi:hypothetical protein